MTNFNLPTQSVLDRRRRWWFSSFDFCEAARFRSAKSFKVFKLLLQISRCSLITFRLSAGNSFEAKIAQSRLISSRTLSIFHVSTCSSVLIVRTQSTIGSHSLHSQRWSLALIVIDNAAFSYQSSDLKLFGRL